LLVELLYSYIERTFFLSAFRLFILLNLISGFFAFSTQANTCIDLFAKPNARLVEFLGSEDHTILVDSQSLSDIQTQNFKLKIPAQELAGNISKITPQPTLETILYPSSGFDAGNAFTIFPEAKTIIGIDNHPFLIGNRSIIRAKVALDANYSYTHVGAVHTLTENLGAAPFIVGELASSLSSFRLLTIQEYKQKAEISHGVIEFDRGPGTPIQRYIHVNGELPYLDDPIPTWMTSITEGGYQALLAKGSETIFDHDSGGDLLLVHLAQNGGLFVDTDGIFLSQRWIDQNTAFSKTSVPSSKLGYNRSTSLILFK
jgi:hypothetical protein